jgi:hypothetical protein
MSNDDSVHPTELPNLVDDGTNNNYGEWEIRSYHKLSEWDLLKYIEGPASQAPIVPPLRHTETHHGFREDGHPSTVRVLGNEAEHEQAVRDAEPWMAGNNTALARIVCAVPGHLLHLVKRTRYAKQAWESLRSVYQPRNSLRAVTIRTKIMTYSRQSDMDIASWLTDMQQLYYTLCNLDTDCLSDHDFTFTILDLMWKGRDEGWTGFLSDLRREARNSESRGLPIHSATFITAIRDYWYRHDDNHHTTAHIFPARFEAQRRINTQKRARTADISTSSAPGRVKRPCIQPVGKTNRQCTNSFCTAPRGHDTAECISYKGAKEGQYGHYWRGPWNIHLPQSQRTKDNNVPPRSHPVRRSHLRRRLHKDQSRRSSTKPFSATTPATTTPVQTVMTSMTAPSSNIPPESNRSSCHTRLCPMSRESSCP